MKIVGGPRIEVRQSSSGAKLPPRAPAGKLVSAEQYNALRDYIAGHLTYLSLVTHPQDFAHNEAGGGGQQSGKGWFSAQITGHTSIGSNRWSYTFVQVRTIAAGLEWSSVQDGITGTAYNTIEHMNTGAGVEGNGVSTTDLATTAPGFEIMPCTIGNIVFVFLCPDGLGGNAYWFSYANGVSGSCT
jgi:hypothetical protein